jgi:hypothetical protein
MLIRVSGAQDLMTSFGEAAAAGASGNEGEGLRSDDGTAFSRTQQDIQDTTATTVAPPEPVLMWAEAMTPDPKEWWKRLPSNGLNIQKFARKRWEPAVQTLVRRRNPKITNEHLRKYKSMTYLQNSLIAIGAPTASRIVDKCEADSDESPLLWSDDITSEVFVALQAAKQSALAANPFVSSIIGAAAHCDAGLLQRHAGDKSSSRTTESTSDAPGRTGQYPARLLRRSTDEKSAVTDV